MTIRRKTGLVVGGTVFSLVVLLYAISRIIFQGSFDVIEKRLIDGFLNVESDDAVRNVNRVADACDHERRNLIAKASDWAQWDDTYRFVADGNRAYVKSNLSPSTLASLSINGIAIINSAGKNVYTLFVHHDSSWTADIVPFVRTLGLADSVMREGKTVSGTATFEGHPMLVAALPVLTSEGKGPVRGMVLFCRFIDDDFVGELASVTHLHLFWNTSAERLQHARDIASCGDSVCTHIVSDSLVAGKVMLSGIDGKPVVYLEVDMPRTVYRHAKKTLALVHKRGKLAFGALIVSMVLTGAFLCAVLFAMLEFSVLRRLRSLAVRSIEIGTEQKGRLRLPVEGRDEISSLAGAINGMLDSLQRSHEGIAERDREKRVLMNNVPVGLCSLSAELIINPEYSRMLARMFGVAECSGLHVNNLLCLDNENCEAATDLLSYLDLVKKRVVPDRELAELNPLREYHFTRRSIDAWYEVSFHSLDRTTAHEADLLMTVRDITEEKELSRRNEDMQRENVQLRHIAENPDYFREFMRETAVIIQNVRELSQQVTPQRVDVRIVNAMFRGVHTIKGVAGSFGLRKIEAITSELEEVLSSVQDLQMMSPAVYGHIMEQLSLLAETFDEVAQMSTGLFGDIFSEDGAVVTVSVAAISRGITEIQEIAEQFPGENPQAALLCVEACTRLRSFKMVPAGKAFARSLRMVSRLCERIGKQCRVKLDGGNVLVDYDDAQVVNQILVHMLRNAMDHGIERSDERTKAGKPEEGLITVALNRHAGMVVIEFSDDGRGVDREKLRTAACENGFVRQDEVAGMTDDELLSLMFLPGLTTTEKITEISGRGVGLDMVADAVKNQLCGTIGIKSTAGEGTVFTIRIPG